MGGIKINKKDSRRLSFIVPLSKRMFVVEICKRRILIFEKHFWAKFKLSVYNKTWKCLVKKICITYKIKNNAMKKTINCNKIYFNRN